MSTVDSKFDPHKAATNEVDSFLKAYLEKNKGKDKGNLPKISSPVSPEVQEEATRVSQAVEETFDSTEKPPVAKETSFWTSVTQYFFPPKEPSTDDKNSLEETSETEADLGKAEENPLEDTKSLSEYLDSVSSLEETFQTEANLKEAEKTFSEDAESLPDYTDPTSETDSVQAKLEKDSESIDSSEETQETNEEGTSTSIFQSRAWRVAKSVGIVATSALTTFIIGTIVFNDLNGSCILSSEEGFKEGFCNAVAPFAQNVHAHLSLLFANAGSYLSNYLSSSQVVSNSPLVNDSTCQFPLCSATADFWAQEVTSPPSFSTERLFQEIIQQAPLNSSAETVKEIINSTSTGFAEWTALITNHTLSTIATVGASALASIAYILKNTNTLEAKSKVEKKNTDEASSNPDQTANRKKGKLRGKGRRRPKFNKLREKKRKERSILHVLEPESTIGQASPTVSGGLTPTVSGGLTRISSDSALNELNSSCPTRGLRRKTRGRQDPSSTLESEEGELQRILKVRNEPSIKKKRNLELSKKERPVLPDGDWNQNTEF